MLTPKEKNKAIKRLKKRVIEARKHSYEEEQLPLCDVEILLADNAEKDKVIEGLREDNGKMAKLYLKMKGFIDGLFIDMAELIEEVEKDERPPINMTAVMIEAAKPKTGESDE